METLFARAGKRLVVEFPYLLVEALMDGELRKALTLARRQVEQEVRREAWNKAVKKAAKEAEKFGLNGAGIAAAIRALLKPQR